MSHNTLRLPRVLIVLIAMIGLGAFATTAFAHSGLGAASPAPGSRVGGTITEIQLRYSSTVADVDGSVTDPDGNIVESEWVQDGNLRVTVMLAEPLSTPGQYAVRHISTDVEDNDRVEAAYLFTYDPAAPPPQLEIIPKTMGSLGSGCSSVPVASSSCCLRGSSTGRCDAPDSPKPQPETLHAVSTVTQWSNGTCTANDRCTPHLGCRWR